MQHLQIHVPMWYRLIQEDFVEGAMIDSLSPATRMGVIKPAARDRLVSAIQSAVRLLSPTIKTLALELADSVQADKWTGRYVSDKRFIAASVRFSCVYYPNHTSGQIVLFPIPRLVRCSYWTAKAAVLHLAV
jgi:hypothetical protein